MGSLSIAVNQPSGRSLIGYIFQESTGFTLNRSTGIFEDIILADVAIADRGVYRNTLLESPLNTYRLVTDVSLWEDGLYTVKVREYSGLVEYSDILVEELSVIGGMVDTSTLDIKISTTPAKTLFAYVKSLSSNQYFNFTTKAFNSIDLVSLGADLRHEYRLPYVETDPGVYTASLSPSTPDGTYSISTVELINDIEVEAGLASNFTLRDGKGLTALRENLVPLNHNTGGVDNLRYVTPAGVGVPGASITVYTTADIANGVYINPIGTTVSDDKGRWALPISVETAASGAYTVLFEKKGHYGPDSVEV